MGTAASAESSFDLNASAAEETERESEREPGRTPELRVWRLLVGIRQEPEKRKGEAGEEQRGSLRGKYSGRSEKPPGFQSLPNDRFIQNS